MRALGLVVVVAASCAFAAQPAFADVNGITVVDLQVDGRGDDPLGVDDRTPVLSWRVKGARDGWSQAAYQVRAAGSKSELASGPYLWDSGKVASDAQTGVPYGGTALESRQAVAWQVRVWSTSGGATKWSRSASWEMGLLENSDWGAAKWIEYPGRARNQPLPIFARAFTIDKGPKAKVTKARLYLSGLGIHLARLNGKPVTDEVLAPGNSNYQLSAEYRTYDVTKLLRRGDNTLGVELGHGTAFVTRSVTNPAVGRTSPYSWWQSEVKGSGTLAAPAAAGDTSVKLSSVSGYHVGGTVNVDTGDGGDRLESRKITAIGTAGADGTGIAFEPALSSAHQSGAQVTGSGNPLPAPTPAPGRPSRRD